jgi:hypothetical protein
MQVGITGHRERPGADWNWVQNAICEKIRKLPDPTRALSSLADGSDQVFARAAISLGVPVLAVIPMDRYERFFKGKRREEYDELLSRCEIKNLKWAGDNDAGFFAAGKYIVDNTDVLFAVWDGEESQGWGGTADIVGYAQKLSKKIVHFNPITKRVVIIGGDFHG